MVSKRWQRSQPFIVNLGLAVCIAFSLGLTYTPLNNPQKVVLLLIGNAVLLTSFVWMYRKYGTSFVKVFRCDYEVAARVVQRMLNAERLPFTKRQVDDQIVFELRMSNTLLVVKEFMLNMPMDNHLKPEIAALLTLRPKTQEHAPEMHQLFATLDEAFAVQGW